MTLNGSAIQGINKAVDIIEAQHSRVDVGRLLGVKAFSLDRVLDMEPGFLEVWCLGVVF